MKSDRQVCLPDVAKIEKKTVFTARKKVKRRKHLYTKIVF